MERRSLNISDQIRNRWAGATVVVLGGGPSLSSDDVTLARHADRIVAINSAVRLDPSVDMLYFCDNQRWYQQRDHARLVAVYQRMNPSGMVVTLENEDLKEKIPRLICLKNEGLHGVAVAPYGVCTGGNSGYQVLNLLIHLGARRAILLGFDMRHVTGRSHYHEEQDHPTPKDAYTKVMIPAFNAYANTFKMRGLEIINATPGSALKCFKQMSIIEALSSSEDVDA